MPTNLLNAFTYMYLYILWLRISTIFVSGLNVWLILFYSSLYFESFHTSYMWSKWGVFASSVCACAVILSDCWRKIGSSLIRKFIRYNQSNDIYQSKQQTLLLNHLIALYTYTHIPMYIQHRNFIQPSVWFSVFTTMCAFVLACSIWCHAIKCVRQ